MICNGLYVVALVKVDESGPELVGPFDVAAALSFAEKHVPPGHVIHLLAPPALKSKHQKRQRPTCVTPDGDEL